MTRIYVIVSNCIENEKNWNKRTEKEMKELGKEITKKQKGGKGVKREKGHLLKALKKSLGLAVADWLEQLENVWESLLRLLLWMI